MGSIPVRVTMEKDGCFRSRLFSINVVPVDNSLRFLQALDDHGVAFESHIYAYGPHGFSVCSSGVNLLGKGCSRMPRWVDDSVAWLKDMFGEFCPEGFTAPACKPLFHTDEAPYLGVDCTYRHLRTQPDAKPVIDALRPSLPSDNARALLDMGEAFDSHLRKMTFRDVLTFSGVSPQTIEEIHARLSRIPNHPRG